MCSVVVRRTLQYRVFQKNDQNGRFFCSAVNAVHQRARLYLKISLVKMS